MVFDYDVHPWLSRITDTSIFILLFRVLWLRQQLWDYGRNLCDNLYFYHEINTFWHAMSFLFIKS